MEGLNEFGTKKLIVITWLSIIFVGIVVYFSTDPLRVEGLLFAGLFLIVVLINFFMKLRRVSMISGEVSTLFSETAPQVLFLGALIPEEGGINLASAIVIIAIGCIVCFLFGEMRYIAE